MFYMQVYLTVKFNKQTTTTLSPKEWVCERTSWESATGSSGFADATEKARGKDSLPDCMQCQRERSKDKVSMIHECTHLWTILTLINLYLVWALIAECSLEYIHLSLVINLFTLMFSHVPSRLCGRRKTYVLGMRLVQAHVVHYFLMIMTLSLHFMPDEEWTLFIRKRDSASKGYSPKLYKWLLNTS